jgi:vesicle transport through interaction with t-SNAREs protein 1
MNGWVKMILLFDLTGTHKKKPIKMDTEGAKDRFARYEENYFNCSRICSRALQQLQEADGDVDKIISSSVELDGELSEAEGYLRAMEVEARYIKGGDKRNLTEKLSDYKTEFREINQKFTKAKFEAESVALKKGATGKRGQLVNRNAKLDNSTSTLMQSRALVEETEKVGSATLSDLENQREVLMDASGKVDQTRTYAEDARHILKQMANRAFWNKFCVYIWILILFAAIITIVYFGFLAPHDDDDVN